MKHLLFLKRFVFVVAVFLCLDLHAEVSYEFRKVLSNGEMSNACIHCMFRDRQGFIWFGTTSGLERFDGYRFKTFHSRTSDPESLLDDGVDEIHEDQNGFTPFGSSRDTKYSSFLLNGTGFALISSRRSYISGPR